METNVSGLFNRQILKLINAGYCLDCASILISPYTLGTICPNCQNLLLKKSKECFDEKN